MGYRELTTELRREAEEKIVEYRQRAEDEASRAREESLAEVERMRRESARKQASEVEEAVRVILSDAERKVLEMRLAGMRDLSGRLYDMAVSLLTGLRERRYEELFTALLRELPDFAWRTVKVNPADLKMARSHFPEAEITAGEDICGGIEVFSEDGSICIANTLEKRLERGWPELLPDLIAAAYREIGRNAFTKG
jgi:V/A-type H+-transporting ATPase subunit E